MASRRSSLILRLLYHNETIHLIFFFIFTDGAILLVELGAIAIGELEPSLAAVPKASIRAFCAKAVAHFQPGQLVPPPVRNQSDVPHPAHLYSVTQNKTVISISICLEMVLPC